MPKVNRTRYALLGMLTFAPMSGYDLKKAFDRSIAYFWQEDFGHIYPELKRLEAAGLVTKTVLPAAGKPARHVYALTDEGRRDLDAWLLLPAARPNLRIEILLKVFFGNRIPKENLKVKIEEERRLALETLAVYRGIEEHIKALSLKPEEGWTSGELSSRDHRRIQKFSLLSLAYGREYYEGVVRWCAEALTMIDEMED